MGLNKDKESSSSQLSLFDYKLPKADFSPTPTPTTAKKSKSADFQDFLWAHREPEVNKTPRFVSLSAIGHGLAIAAITFLMIPKPHDEISAEPITIEIEDLGSSTLGSPVEATQGGTPAVAMNPSMDALVDEALSQAPPVAAALPPPSPAVPAQALKAAAPAPAPAPIAKTEAKAVAKAIPVVEESPVAVDSSTGPELEAATHAALAEAPAENALGDELDSDFNKIEEANQAALEKEQAEERASLAAQAQKEKEQQLAAAEKARKAEQKRLADEKAKRRAEEAAAIAAAATAEKAAQQQAAEKAAADQQAALVAEQQQLDEENERNKQALAEAATLGSGQGEMDGPGQGNDGASEAAAALSGAPTGLRSLDQLRQMPGNPKPQYDRIERRRGDQGQVAFAAYISKDGYPSQFKMLQSTGYRNLDGKTLAALKKWRFHPGQEGWVELPFRWDLKGGVQQDGGLLRRSAQGF